MKMQVEVNLDEMFTEEDELNLTEQIKDGIAYKVRSDILTRMSNTALDVLKKRVEVEVNESLKIMITSHVSQLIVSGVIKNPHSADMTIADFIESRFHNNQCWRDLGNYIDRTAKGHTAEMKRQYDAAFAMHIVDGLKDQGLLKEDVISLLLDPKKGAKK